MKRVVKGVVRHENEVPVAYAGVELLARDLDGSTVLTKVRATQNGFFEAELDREALPKGKHLVVRIGGPGERTWESEIVFRPPPSVWLDLAVGDDGVARLTRFEKPEFETLASALRKRSRGRGLHELEETAARRDISFVAKEGKLPADRLVWICLAHRLEHATDVGANVWYGFLAQGVPAGLPDALADGVADADELEALVDRIRAELALLAPDVQRSLLQQAAESRLIGPAGVADLDGVLAKLGALRVQTVLDEPLSVGKTPLKQVLGASKLPAAKHAAFADLLARRGTEGIDLWAEAPKAGITEREAADVRTTLEVGGFVKNHVPAIAAVRGRLKDAGSVAALAKLRRDEWEDVLRAAGPNAIPPNLAGDTPEERIANFATEIRERVERSYATAALAARIDASPTLKFADSAGVNALLDAQPALDLRRQSIDALLNPEEGERPAANPDTVADLQRMQRVLRLARVPATAEKVLEAGFDSAMGLYEQGRGRAVATLAEAGVPQGEAHRLFESAHRRYAGTLALLGQLSEAFNGVELTPTEAPQPPFGANGNGKLSGGGPAALSPNATIDDFPTLRGLFGSLDLCQCKHCQSVYGPAAYFVDLLRWLRLRQSTVPGTSVKDVLFARRPDLGKIALTCTNTTTELPYIDLVCELLERTIAPLAPLPGPPRIDPRHQTGRPAAELLAAPEHVHEAAYVPLASAFVPFTLPFDLFAEDARAHLAQLGVERWRLLDACRAAGAAPAAAQAYDERIAGERLGMPDAERTAVVTPAPGQVDAHWGRPNAPVALGTAGALLDVAGLTYAQLEELVTCAFIRPGGQAITIVATADDAAAEHRVLQGLTAAHLDRIHRFLRLWRRTAWTPWELDLAIASPAIGAGQLAPPALARLTRLQEVQGRLGLGLEETLALYDKVVLRARTEPEPVPSLYDRLFRPRGQAPAPPFEPAAIDVASSAAKIADHLAPVRAALGLSAADAQRLAATTDGDLTLANLSAMVRRRLLAKAVRLPVADLLDLLALTGPELDPFAGPEATLRFLDALEDVRASGATVAELRHVLTHAPESPAGLRERDALALLRRIGTERAKLTEELTSDAEPPAALAQRRLAMRPELAGAGVLDEALALIEGRSKAVDPGEAVVSVLGFLDDVLGLEQRLTPLAPLDADALPAEVAARAAELADRYAVVLWRLLALESRELLAAACTTVTALDAEATRTLLAHLAPGGAPLAEVLANAAGLATADDAADAPAALRAVLLLHKAAAAVRRAGIARDDLPWVLTQGPGKAGLLALTALPTAPEPPGAPTRFAAWRDLVRFGRLAARPAPEGVSAQAILDGPASAMPAQLAQLTGWSQADVQTAVAQLGLDHRKLATYDRLARLAEMVRATGVPVARLLVWAGRTPTKADADEVAAAARSRSSEEAWPSVSQKVQDVLRERRRDALVAYLLAHKELVQPAPQGDWNDPNDVLEHLLIDVQMGACMPTTRIRQAIAAVQLFVQRCRLNLEPQVTVDADADDEWLQWEWMQRYRVWEANRKVFLYPENWLWPEQRADKSQQFRELEEELLQGDITDERAADALSAYVEKLHEIAKPEVMALHHEHERDTLHVIARTRGNPPAWLYRRRAHGIWSPWERLDLDIKGEQVTLAMHNRRLHLFWPHITEKGDPAQANLPMQASDGPPPAPRKYLEMQLGWTSLRADGWAPIKLSDRKLVHPWPRPDHAFLLRGHPGPGGALLVDVFISSSPEFNDRRKVGPKGERLQEREWLVSPYNEAARPWHSSQFVFDGDVVEVRLKNVNNALWTVRAGYGLDGRRHRDLPVPASSLVLPAGAKYRHGALVARDSAPTGPLHTLAETGGARLDQGELLKKPGANWALVVSHQDPQQSADRPFAYQDDRRTYLIDPQRWWLDGSGVTTVAPPSPSQGAYYYAHRFAPMHHPLTGLLARELLGGGVDRIYQRRLQVAPWTYPSVTPFSFGTTYKPAAHTTVTLDNDGFDFGAAGAASQYNWEIFLHVPLMLALRLGESGRYEEAMRWFHRIFDPANPTAEQGARRFWITKPLYELSDATIQKQRIEALLRDVNAKTPDALAQVERWRHNPFQPHHVAAVRWSAYQRTVIMRYLDTLIDWGDALFTQDTPESISEATQLYVMASDILGPRPRFVPPVESAEGDMTYDHLEPELDAFANALVDAEGAVAADEQTPPVAGGGGAPAPPQPGQQPPQPPPPPALPVLTTFYFKIPPNQELLAYWDRVEDQLRKIRSCMDITGAKRRLSPFDPPIDPGVLVKAVGAGGSVSDALAALTAPLPAYRYPVVLARAKELAGEVRQLGAALLAALEKGDAEELALLRQSQELRMLAAMRTSRERAVDEAREAVASLERTRELTEFKQRHFEALAFMSPAETAALVMSASALGVMGAGAAMTTIGGALALVPGFQVGGSGVGGSPHVTVRTGGEYFAKGMELGGSALQQLAGLLDRGAGMATTLAGYERRQEEWRFQAESAERELAVVERQIAGAQARLAAAEHELVVHDRQAEHAHEVDEAMRAKFTNRELYQWTARELRGLHTSAYRLALDVARRAERCFRFETGDAGASFVSGSGWSSRREGLLSGEQLAFDLQRMDAAYLDRTSRDFEITRHVSLAEVDPLALLTLKSTGTCPLILDERLFDLDHPGHFQRRIKTVAVSIPAVTGPYTSVNCRLSLVRNHVRVKDTPGASYPRDADGDERFVSHDVAISSIVTSSGRDDTGLFTADVRDERYLPFEGAGVDSEWRIDLRQEHNRFDLATISDVVLTIRYTARYASALEGPAAAAALGTSSEARTGMRLFSVRHEFPDAWQAFVSGGALVGVGGGGGGAGNGNGAGGNGAGGPGTGGHALTLPFGPGHFPFETRGKPVTITGLALAADGGDADLAFTTDLVADGIALPAPEDGERYRQTDLIGELSEPLGPLTLTAAEADGLRDLFVIVQWQVPGGA